MKLIDRGSVQRRRYHRVLAAGSVRYVCGLRRTGIATLADVDHSGVGISADRRLAPGQRLMLIVDEPIHGKRRVELKGMVAWCEPAEVNGQFRAGIRIYRTDDETRLTLCLLVWAGLTRMATTAPIGDGPFSVAEWRLPRRETVDLSNVWRNSEQCETQVKQATAAGF